MITDCDIRSHHLGIFITFTLLIVGGLEAHKCGHWWIGGTQLWPSSLSDPCTVLPVQSLLPLAGSQLAEVVRPP